MTLPKWLQELKDAEALYAATPKEDLNHFARFTRCEHLTWQHLSRLIRIAEAAEADAVSRETYRPPEGFIDEVALIQGLRGEKLWTQDLRGGQL